MTFSSSSRSLQHRVQSSLLQRSGVNTISVRFYRANKRVIDRSVLKDQQHISAPRIPKDDLATDLFNGAPQANAAAEKPKINVADDENLVTLRVTSDQSFGSGSNLPTLILKRSEREFPTVLDAAGDNAIHNAIKAILMANDRGSQVQSLARLFNPKYLLENVASIDRQALKRIISENKNDGSSKEKSIIDYGTAEDVDSAAMVLDSGLSVAKIPESSSLVTNSKSKAESSEANSTTNTVDIIPFEKYKTIGLLVKANLYLLRGYLQKKRAQYEGNSREYIGALESDLPEQLREWGLKEGIQFEGLFRRRDLYQSMPWETRMESISNENVEEIVNFLTQDENSGPISGTNFQANAPFTPMFLDVQGKKKDGGVQMGFVPHSVTRGTMNYLKLEMVRILVPEEIVGAKLKYNARFEGEVSREEHNALFQELTNELTKSWNVILPSKERFSKATGAVHAAWFQYVNGVIKKNKEIEGWKTEESIAKTEGSLAKTEGCNSLSTETGAENAYHFSTLPPLALSMGKANVSMAVRILAKARGRLLKSKTPLPEFACLPKRCLDGKGRTYICFQLYEI